MNLTMPEIWMTFLSAMMFFAAVYFREARINWFLCVSWPLAGLAIAAACSIPGQEQSTAIARAAACLIVGASIAFMIEHWLEVQARNKRAAGEALRRKD